MPRCHFLRALPRARPSLHGPSCSPPLLAHSFDPSWSRRVARSPETKGTPRNLSSLCVCTQRGSQVSRKLSEAFFTLNLGAAVRQAGNPPAPPHRPSVRSLHPPGIPVAHPVLEGRKDGERCLTPGNPSLRAPCGLCVCSPGVSTRLRRGTRPTRLFGSVPSWCTGTGCQCFTQGLPHTAPLFSLLLRQPADDDRSWFH